MSLHTIKKGLDLPLAGEPEQRIDNAPAPRRIALLAADYVGMKPTMHVQEGDAVRRGQLLFEDKKTPRVRYTSLGAGRVVAVNRGDRRALQSLVVELDEAERSGGGDVAGFESYTGKPAGELSREQVVDLLVESGQWTAIRQRPFSRVANPEETPAALFVTAMDSNPHAPSVDVVLRGREADFERGLQALSKLTDGPVYVCKAPGSSVKTPSGGKFSVEEFDGPHPAGTVGLHIHKLAPVNRKRTVWHIGYQDVAAVGRLFATGALDVERVVSLAGPSVKSPRLLRTRLGAAIEDLAGGEVAEGEQRLISGSAFSGRTAEGEIFGYLGRFHQQITVLHEGRERELFGWLVPGANKFSLLATYIGRLIPGQKFRMTTNVNGSHRAMVPTGMHESVMPMDILPTFLMRALLTQDVERAEELGVLELDEEDVALCTFVDIGKAEYGPLLRQMLTTIEKEG